jgi:hypothetical protein
VKLGLNIVGVLIALVGLVWVLQGVGILPGSFMSGDSKWAIIGIVALVIGGALLVYNNRRPTSAA